MSDTEQDEREDHREHVADALRPVLDEGDSYNVYCQDSEVFVTDADTSVIAAKHPRLYGRLLALDTELERSATALGRIPFIVLAAFCVGLHLRWWDDWLGANLVDKLNSFWFFLLAFIVVYQLFTPIKGLLDRNVYRRYRDDLLALIHDEGVDRDTVLAMIDADGALSRIAYQLKLDADAVKRPG